MTASGQTSAAAVPSRPCSPLSGIQSPQRTYKPAPGLFPGTQHLFRGPRIHFAPVPSTGLGTSRLRHSPDCTNHRSARQRSASLDQQPAFPKFEGPPPPDSASPTPVSTLKEGNRRALDRLVAEEFPKQDRQARLDYLRRLPDCLKRVQSDIAKFRIGKEQSEAEIATARINRASLDDQYVQVKPGADFLRDQHASISEETQSKINRLAELRRQIQPAQAECARLILDLDTHQRTEKYTARTFQTAFREEKHIRQQLDAFDLIQAKAQKELYNWTQLQIKAEVELERLERKVPSSWGYNPTSVNFVWAVDSVLASHPDRLFASKQAFLDFKRICDSKTPAEQRQLLLDTPAAVRHIKAALRQTRFEAHQESLHKERLARLKQENLPVESKSFNDSLKALDPILPAHHPHFEDQPRTVDEPGVSGVFAVEFEVGESFGLKATLAHVQETLDTEFGKELLERRKFTQAVVRNCIQGHSREAVRSRFSEISGLLQRSVLEKDPDLFSSADLPTPPLKPSEPDSSLPPGFQPPISSAQPKASPPLLGVNPLASTDKPSAASAAFASSSVAEPSASTVVPQYRPHPIFLS